MPDRGSTYNHIPLPVTSGGLTFYLNVNDDDNEN